MATSVFTPGKNRVAFGMIDDQSGFVYGKTALYVARARSAKALGPSPPPPTCSSRGRYRSKQAATETDPFAAVYGAEVPLKRAGQVLDPRRHQGRLEDVRGARAAPGRHAGRGPRPRGRREGAQGGDRHEGQRARRRRAPSTRAFRRRRCTSSRSPTWSGRSRSRCCSRRRSSASRACAVRWSTSCSS